MPYCKGDWKYKLVFVVNAPYLLKDCKIIVNCSICAGVYSFIALAYTNIRDSLILFIKTIICLLNIV